MRPEAIGGSGGPTEKHSHSVSPSIDQWSSTGDDLPHPGDVLSRDIFGVVLLASSGQAPGRTINMLRYTEQPLCHQQRTIRPRKSTVGAEAEKAGCRPRNGQYSLRKMAGSHKGSIHVPRALSPPPACNTHIVTVIAVGISFSAPRTTSGGHTPGHFLLLGACCVSTLRMMNILCRGYLRVYAALTFCAHPAF